LLVSMYRERFAASSSASLLQLPADPGPQHAWHLFIVRLHLDRLRIDRQAVIERLRERNIGSSVHFIPLHRHPYYRETWGVDAAGFPNADREFERAISLPLWPGMRPADVDRVVRTLDEILSSARR
jgi:perosamine synthetase